MSRYLIATLRTIYRRSVHRPYVKMVPSRLRHRMTVVKTIHLELPSLGGGPFESIVTDRETVKPEKTKRIEVV